MRGMQSPGEGRSLNLHLLLMKRVRRSSSRVARYASILSVIELSCPLPQLSCATVMQCTDCGVLLR